MNFLFKNSTMKLNLYNNLRFGCLFFNNNFIAPQSNIQRQFLEKKQFIGTFTDKHKTQQTLDRQTLDKTKLRHDLINQWIC